MNKLFIMLLALGLVSGIQTITTAEETVPADEVQDTELLADEMAGGDLVATGEEVTEMKEGTVSSVDAEAGKVTISYAGDAENTAAASDNEFWVKENSMLMKEDQAITLADVKAGDKVVFASLTNEDGGNVLSHLHVMGELRKRQKLNFEDNALTSNAQNIEIQDTSKDQSVQNQDKDYYLEPTSKTDSEKALKDVKRPTLEERAEAWRKRQSEARKKKEQAQQAAKDESLYERAIDNHQGRGDYQHFRRKEIERKK